MHYHAHVYWNDDHARAIAVGLRDQLADLGCPLGRIWDQSIGPHPWPMYQVNYDSTTAAEVEALLSGKGLTVLLHEDTGNDLHDHTHGVRWIGDPLDLDLVWLENYQKEKGLP